MYCSCISCWLDFIVAVLRKPPTVVFFGLSSSISAFRFDFFDFDVRGEASSLSSLCSLAESTGLLALSLGFLSRSRAYCSSAAAAFLPVALVSGPVASAGLASACSCATLAGSETRACVILGDLARLLLEDLLAARLGLAGVLLRLFEASLEEDV